MNKIAIIYDFFPHYRAGVIKSLNKSNNFKYYFYGSRSSRDKSIRSFKFSDKYNFIDAKLYQIGSFVFQFRIFFHIINNKMKYCIFLGNPNFITTWFYVFFLRLFNVKCYYWTHGWISNKESFFKRKIRNFFFSLSDGIFLYGNRSRDIGVKEGFKSNFLHVINNSLDFDYQTKIFNNIKNKTIDELKNELSIDSDKRIIICSARLTKKCSFDLLLRAIHLLKKFKYYYKIIFVGDGPEVLTLQNLSKDLNLDVIFWGECYDENILSKLYHVSDLTVCPGKIGLTAMHSMAYGTPVITHGNLDNQMPEVEAIIPGVTGDFFIENSYENLAEIINNWFLHHSIKPVHDCVSRIQFFYTPIYQRERIESVLINELSN